MGYISDAIHTTKLSNPICSVLLCDRNDWRESDSDERPPEWMFEDERRSLLMERRVVEDFLLDFFVFDLDPMVDLSGEFEIISNILEVKVT